MNYGDTKAVTVFSRYLINKVLSVIARLSVLNGRPVIVSGVNMVVMGVLRGVVGSEYKVILDLTHSVYDFNVSDDWGC